MKKLSKPVLLIAGAALVVVAIVGGVALSHNSSPSKTDKKQVVTNYAPRDASKILTADIADQVAGKDATTKPAVATSTKDLKVTTSVYYSKTKLVSLSVRSPLNKAVAADNIRHFNTSKSKNAQVVKDFGDSAYWDPMFHTFSILKGSTWYILSAGGLDASARSLDQSKAFAKLIVDKL